VDNFSVLIAVIGAVAAFALLAYFLRYQLRMQRVTEALVDAEEALDRGEVELVVVAKDARAAADLPAVAAAVQSDHGLVFGTKAELGTALGRPETGVVAILDQGISASLKRATALLELPSPRPRGAKKTELVTETG